MKKCVLLLLSFCILKLFANDLCIPISQPYSEFVAIQPNDMHPVPDYTSCKVSYDKENIYFEFTAKKQKDFSINKKGRNDEFQDSDFLRAQITTLPMDNFCYVFYAYPDGSKIDAIRDSDFNLSEDWDSHFNIENSFTEEFWFCKMTIPFKDLRFKGEAPYQWNISFCRQYINDNSLFSAPFLSISQMGRDYYKKGYPLIIDEDLPKNLNLQLIPYILPIFNIKNEDFRFDKNSLGGDVSFKPSSLMNLKVSFNPDFSDIPLDRAQNNFNTKNEPFYNENRYFFTEDLDVFAVDNDIFYSRNIKQPDYALKFTGTSEKLSYGALYCKDIDYNFLDWQNNLISYKNNRYAIFTLKPKTDNYEFGFSTLMYNNDKFENYVFQLNPAIYFDANTSLIWKNNISVYRDSSDFKEGLDTFINFFTRSNYWNKYFKLGFYTKNFNVKMGRVYDPSIAYSEFNIDYSDNNLPNWEDFSFSFWINPTCSTEPFTPTNINTGVYLKLDTHGPMYYDFNVSYALIKENNNFYYLPNTRNYISYNDKIRNFSVSSMYSIGQEYLYSLDKSTLFAYIEPAINWNPIQYFNFNISCLLYNYPNLNKTDQINADNLFHIFNAEIKSYLTNNISIVTGYSYQRYFLPDYSFYGNLQTEISDNLLIYVGVSKKRYEFESVNDYDLAYKAWQTDFYSAYLKFRAVLSF